ncbi:MAG: DUF3100 domain-containing protein [Suilimivivens sp.]
MGSVVGTVFISVLASIVASWNIFDPIALGMACGVRKRINDDCCCRNIR